MTPVHVLVSARVTGEQLRAMRAAHPRLVIHGEPGGVAIMDGAEVDHKGIDYPEERPDLDVDGLLAQAEVLIATRIPVALGDRAPRLRWLQFTSAGVDQLWKPFLDGGTIVVTSAKGIHGVPMAEFVLSCLLAFAKGWPRLIAQQRAGQWQKFVVDELSGRTLVVVGVGEIGGAVARLAKAFGMRVIGIRRRASRDVPPELDAVAPVERLHATLAEADYVVGTLPLTARTERFFRETEFRVMRPSAVFVNVGRGRTVDEGALIRALREGWIAGAGLDVFEREPLPVESPLWTLPNVLLSPHMGSDTPRYMDRFTDLLCDNLGRYAEGRPLRNVVDPVERY